jgi:hypothetical protein
MDPDGSLGASAGEGRRAPRVRDRRRQLALGGSREAGRPKRHRATRDVGPTQEIRDQRLDLVGRQGLVAPVLDDDVDPARNPTAPPPPGRAARSGRAIR